MNLTFDDHITNPTPSPASECAPPWNQMEGGGGAQHTRLQVREWGSPNYFINYK